MNTVMTPLTKFVFLCLGVTMIGLVGTVVSFFFFPEYNNVFFGMMIGGLLTGWVTSRLTLAYRLSKKKEDYAKLREKW